MSLQTIENRFNWRSLLPGSLGSLCIHALVLLIVSTSLRGCQKGLSGDSGGEVYREVGLFVVEGEATDNADGDSSDNGDAATNSATEDVPRESLEPQPSEHLTETPLPQNVVPSDAPRLSDLLADNRPVDNAGESTGTFDLPSLIGPGAPLSGLPATGGATSSASSAADAAGMQAAGVILPGPGETAFMNVTSKGKSFVYLIDVSGSMGEENRLALAKSQLKSSLRLLQPTQEFQVIFYSDYPMRMSLRGRGKSQRSMYPATAANLLWANQEIDAVQPQQGTQHMPALIDAVSLNADVLYFLTDGREPKISPYDLKRLRLLSGNTTIHVIEFGSGALVDRGDSWLQQLARQSNGEYREFNTSR